MIGYFRLTCEPVVYRNNTFALRFDVKRSGLEDFHFERIIPLEMLEQEGWFDHMLKEATTQLKRHLSESLADENK